MIRESLYSSMRMGLYDPIKQLLAPNAKDKDDFTLTQKIMAGGLSGAIGSAIVNPTDLVKVKSISKAFQRYLRIYQIRFQSVTPGQQKPYKNTFHGFYTIYIQEGFKGLYKVSEKIL